MKLHLTMAAALLAGLTLGAPGHAQTGGPLNPNSVEAAALKGLPHVTDSISQAILAGKPYATTAAYNDVVARSLNEEQRKELYARLFVPINLNKASRAEIMLIPGMTTRMAREFEEYRPYANIEQFRKEIGKYVDAKEVARLESYVSLK